MAQTLLCRALVLRSYDVGEADRFYIFLTREHGKLTARGSGARRLGSRLGGILLPFSEAQVQLRQSGSSSVITGAQSIATPGLLLTSSLVAFHQVHGIVDLLLRLLPDGDPVSRIFDLARAAFTSLEQSPHVPLAFRIGFAEELGLLPEERVLRSWEGLHEEDHAFIATARAGSLSDLPHLESPMRLERCVERILSEHLGSDIQRQAMSV